MRALLVDHTLTEVQILEGETVKDGRMRVRAILQVADKVNNNRRVYPRKVLEREVAKIQQKISTGEAFGAGDHPSDGRTRIHDVTSLWERVWIESDGIVKGDAVIIPTAKGRDLQEILRAGGLVSVSSRGFGDTEAKEWNGQPADVVKDDYDLYTWDFVIGGGFPEAKVQQVREAEESAPHSQGGQQMEIKTVAELRAAYPALMEQLTQEIRSDVEKELVESFEDNVLARLGDEKELVEEHVRAQLLEEYQVEAMQETLRAVAEAIAPWIDVPLEEGKVVQAGTSTDDLDAVVEEADAKIEEANARAEAAEAEAASKIADLQGKLDEQEAKAYLSEVLKTEQHATLIAEELASCKTKKEIDERLPHVKARIKRIVEASGMTLPTGRGIVESSTNDDKPALTEEQKMHRRMAGLPV